MIEIDRVTRRYGERTAVCELDLTVKPGEVFAFLGHNGAGKTTTIKMIVGLLHPTAGHVRVCGIDVATQPREASRNVGYVPDEPYLYDKLTGREFLEFTAEMYGLDAQAARDSIVQRIVDFELQAFVDRLAESYSHGMRQRVIFASALVHRPPVLVVDEPMVGLDPRSMRFVKRLLKQEAEQGASVFLSTHTLSVAEEIADRIGIIENGRLRFLGSVHELRQQLQASDSSLEDLFLSLTGSDAVSASAPPSGINHAPCIDDANSIPGSHSSDSPRERLDELVGEPLSEAVDDSSRMQPDSERCDSRTIAAQLRDDCVAEPRADLPEASQDSPAKIEQ